MIRPLIKYSIVGCSGVVINTVTYFYLVNKFLFSYNKAAVIAFLIALISNYNLNSYFTFLFKFSNLTNYFVLFFKYFIANILGLLINLSVLNLFIHIYSVEYNFYGQLIGIACAMSVSFLISLKKIFIYEQ